jgi:5'-deoxynucleotidase YfbR-like HD superfamily hydrolase
MSSIDPLFKFLQFLIDFQHIERVIYIQGFERKENDVEHSYQLAMLCWFTVMENQLSLDVHKVISYALVHDLVEVYA